jgi:hypothetical protein
MTLFSENILSLIIFGALIWTALGVLILLGLLLKDYLNKQIW